MGNPNEMMNFYGLASAKYYIQNNRTIFLLNFQRQSDRTFKSPFSEPPKLHFLRVRQSNICYFCGRKKLRKPDSGFPIMKTKVIYAIQRLE